MSKHGFYIMKRISIKRMETLHSLGSYNSRINLDRILKDGEPTHLFILRNYQTGIDSLCELSDDEIIYSKYPENFIIKDLSEYDGHSLETTILLHLAMGSLHE